ncbi:uncharacterized protein LOC9659969 [Selaginella moellendorffii]|uniref:uncharacterized protein LOC9659969 n=1 Tax=Selaginella moellendorffii TaxID=88036 RepID=UPI000D1CCFB7|nr:uncharacterized protein LOC9659969 [Selaginella moellendorffii]|eukprot:XP_024520489.1 uncharacterized protein LOC9659969 [Selaginella moellendorffii]
MIAVASYAREYVWPDFTCATQALARLLNARLVASTVQGAYAKMAVDASGIATENLCMSCRIRHLTTVKESLPMSQYKRPGNGNDIGASVEEPGTHEQEIYSRKLWVRLDYSGPGTHPGNPHEHQLEENVDYYPPRNHNDSPPTHKHIPGNEVHPERHLVDALDYVPARTHTPSPVH